jgi:hypothetical protein
MAVTSALTHSSRRLLILSIQAVGSRAAVGRTTSDGDSVVLRTLRQRGAVRLGRRLGIRRARRRMAAWGRRLRALRRARRRRTVWRRRRRTVRSGRRRTVGGGRRRTVRWRWRRVRRDRRRWIRRDRWWRTVPWRWRRFRRIGRRRIRRDRWWRTVRWRWRRFRRIGRRRIRRDRRRRVGRCRRLRPRRRRECPLLRQGRETRDRRSRTVWVGRRPVRSDGPRALQCVVATAVLSGWGNGRAGADPGGRCGDTDHAARIVERGTAGQRRWRD